MIIPNSKLFMHLSDIHFSKESGIATDHYKDIRSQVVNSANQFVQGGRKIDGILISGDIAYSGKYEEYDRAKSWLKELAASVGLLPEQVWCVPGNHDVDRSIINQSIFLKNMHSDLRSTPIDEIDKKIFSYMIDGSGSEILYHPLREFNKFAASFGCNITPTEPYWKTTLPVGNGCNISIYGLNSTIISDHMDDISKELILGSYQKPSQLTNHINVVLCHHPPSWWKDRETVESIIHERSTLELYGHKHKFSSVVIRDSLQLVAGAVQPEKINKEWNPCYNFIEIGTSQDMIKKVHLVITIMDWDAHTGIFKPLVDANTGDQYFKHEFDLDPIGFPISETVSPQPVPSTEIQTPTAKEEYMNNSRALAYNFFELPHVKRMDIARKLELITDQDEGLYDWDLYKRIIQRAVDKGLINKLLQEVTSNTK